MYRNPVPAIKSVMNDKFVLTQLILDCTSSDISSILSLSPQECCLVEQISIRLLRAQSGTLRVVGTTRIETLYNRSKMADTLVKKQIHYTE